MSRRPHLSTLILGVALLLSGSASAKGLLRAADVLVGGGPVPGACLTPILESTASHPRPIPVRRRALLVLQNENSPFGEQYPLPSGGVIIYQKSELSFERLDAPDLDGDTIPDWVPHISETIRTASRELTEKGFATPATLQVVLLRAPGRLRGYSIRLERGVRLVLEIPSDVSLDELDRMTRHQFAHAVTQTTGTQIPPAWSEAFAQYASATLSAGPDGGQIAFYENRLSSMRQGLVDDSFEHAIGNALWFHFIDEAYTPIAVRTVLEELSRPQPLEVALQKGLIRGSGATLAEAIREFQLWNLLVGDWNDERHLSFADRFTTPYFEEKDRPVAGSSFSASIGPLGMVQFPLSLARPQDGVRLSLDGTLGVQWAADLLLLNNEGALRRVSIPLDTIGKGTIDWPLAGIRSAVLMLRRTDAREGEADIHASSRLLSGYPYRMLDNGPSAARDGDGVWIHWDTLDERDVAGFHVLRSIDEGAFERISPIGVPGTGGAGLTTGYAFFDPAPPTAESLRYRVDGFTRNGMHVASSPASIELSESH